MSFLNDLCGGEINNLEKISKSDPSYQNWKLMETVFTELVDRLRDPQFTKCPPINELMTLCWRLVGNRIVPVSVMPSVKTLSFWCEVQGKDWLASIICPGNWLKMLDNDPYMQIGGMVFQACRAKDYWNHRLPGLWENETERTMFDRAASYEAEILLWVSSIDESFTPNDYQKSLLKKFPNGLADAKELHYESRPFPATHQEIILAGPPFPVDTQNLK